MKFKSYSLGVLIFFLGVIPNGVYQFYWTSWSDDCDLSIDKLCSIFLALDFPFPVDAISLLKCLRLFAVILNSISQLPQISM